MIKECVYGHVMHSLHFVLQPSNIKTHLNPIHCGVIYLVLKRGLIVMKHSISSHDRPIYLNAHTYYISSSSMDRFFLFSRSKQKFHKSRIFKYIYSKQVIPPCTSFQSLYLQQQKMYKCHVIVEMKLPDRLLVEKDCPLHSG